MAKRIEKHSINCSIRHTGAFVVKWDDGSYRVKCSFIKQCGDSSPYLKDHDYVRSFKRAPEYMPK